MAVVRIPDDIHQRVTDIAVQATIAAAQPVNQARVYRYLLRMALQDHTPKEIVRLMIAWIAERNETSS